MNKLYVILDLIIAIIICSCCSYDDTDIYIGTRELDSNGFIEIYRSSDGGVYGGCSKSYYYTDSSNYKILIDDIDDDYGYSFHIYDDILYALKYKNEFVNINLPGVKVIKDVKAIDISNGKVID